MQGMRLHGGHACHRAGRARAHLSVDRPCLRKAGFETHLPLLQDRGALHACLFVKAPPGLTGEDVCAALCSLSEGAVEAKQYYRPLVDREAAPEAWRAYDQCVCLPLHVDMSAADVDYMCTALGGLTDKENCARVV